MDEWVRSVNQAAEKKRQERDAAAEADAAALEKRAVAEKEKEEYDRTLATHVIFQSDVNNLYLHFDGKDPDTPNLRYAGDYSFDLETIYEIVRQTGNTGLIHILCLRNHKYWSNFKGDGWITAMADKPKEEESDIQCTLFRPVYVHSNNKSVLKLQHVNTGHYVRLFRSGGDYDGCLYLYPKLEDVETFTFIDWEKVVVLPDLIRIKGDNGDHLKAGKDGYMGFNHKAKDNSFVFDFEVSPSRDGGVRLRSTYYDNYWTDMDDSDWVLLKNASTTVHETNTVFIPTGDVGYGIQIRSLKSGKFCKRLTASGKENCLATQRSYVDEWSKMEIDEPVISRKMNDFKYDFNDARPYSETISALVSDFVTNSGPDPVNKLLRLTHTVTNTTNWSISHAVKVGFEVTATAKLPVVGDTGLKVSSEYTFTKNNGGAKEDKQEIVSETTVPVRPKTRMKGTLMEKRLSYDIPYSYTQHDVLKNGTPKVYEKHGICTLDHGYSYDTVVVPVPYE